MKFILLLHLKQLYGGKFNFVWALGVIGGRETGGGVSGGAENGGGVSGGEELWYKQ